MFKKIEMPLMLAALLVMLGIVGRNDYQDQVEGVKFECAKAYGDRARVIEINGIVKCTKQKLEA